MASDDVEVLCPQGRLDSATGPAFEDEVNRAIDNGNGRVVFDMAGLKYISSAGLRIVLQAAKRARSKGGRIGLCALNAQILDIFEISGFTAILDIFESRDQALAAIRAS